MSTDDAVIAATRRWLERAVIRLGLCPFASAPYAQGRVRIAVSRASEPDAILQDLVLELERLRDEEPETLETTLLVLPEAFPDFLDYNDFLDVAEAAVDAWGLVGEIQIASFHPDYRFADADPDDVANCTNRSPYPILHLLREASVERAVASHPDVDAVPERNIARLRELGPSGWAALGVGPGPR